jgi:hypothetical protein
MAGDYVKNGQPITAQWANDIVGALHSRRTSLPKKTVWFKNGGTTCVAFAKLKRADNKTYIRGGILYAGDATLNVDDHELSVATNGTWLLSLQLDVEANRDTNNEIILPGIKTTTDIPAYNLKPWTEGTNYDPNTNPNVSDGIGTIVIPIGKLIIENNIARLEAAECGNIRVLQCGGVLSHERV